MTFRIFTITILSVLFFSPSFGQLNQGGTPPSFNSNFKNNFQEVNIEPVSQNWIATHEAESDKNGTVQLISRNFDTNLNLNNSGNWETKKNGDRIWRLKINAADAQGINTYFNNFFLPQGAKLFIYNPEKTQILGAYTSENNHESKLFSAEIIFGTSIILEYYEPKDVLGKGSFTLEKVGSFFRDLVHNDAKDFEDSDDCEININCSEGSNWQNQKKGVARILVTGSDGSGWCSGTLVNNTNADCRAYMLTAFHCGDKSTTNDFLQYIFYFNYEFSGCNSSFVQPSTTNKTFTGSTLKARANDLTSSSTSSDFMLLELTSSLPSSLDVYFNGWDVSGVAPSSGVSIHHPAGDVKKISTFTSTPSSKKLQWNSNGTYSTINGTTHWSLNWASTANGQGVTEGGSSGSPLFGSNGLVIGTLSGGSSKCDNPNANDQYGKMSYHWTSNSTSTARQLKPFLDPTNSGVTSLQGTYAPCATSPLLDIALESFQSPSEKSCSFDVTPQINIKNTGNVILLSAKITYQVNNGASQIVNWTGNLAAGSKTVVNLNNFTAPQTNNTITATVSNPNGLTDGNASNNTATLNFQAGVSLDLPFQELAETNPLVNNIIVSNPDNDRTWEYSNYGSFGTSSYGFYVDNWDYDAVDQYDWLITDAYDFSNSIDEEMYFDLAYTYYQQTNGSNVSYDSLGIAYSLDCGENYYWLWKEGGQVLATVAGGLGEEFVPFNDEWEHKTINLSLLNGESTVNFAFIAINGYGNNLYIDNIGIGKVLLGIDKIKTWGNNISVFPNPANDILNFDFSNIETQNLKLSIYNNVGQKVYENISFQDKQIDISKFNTGLYFVEFQSESNTKMLKFLKK